MLTRLGLDFLCQPADIDETPLKDEKPHEFALRMAIEKAAFIADNHPEACVIGADTVVTLSGKIFGKPRDRQEALSILQALQGERHEVITGYAMLQRQSGLQEADTVSTQVQFGRFDQAVLKAYINTGEPMDKAGAYGIQDAGTFLVKGIKGSYSNVVGLPVHRVVNLLLKHDMVKAGDDSGCGG